MGQPVGNLLIGVFYADDVSLPEKRAQTHIVFVSAESLVVAYHPAILPGQKIYAEQRPG